LTGATEMKSMEQRTIFGGFSRTQLDPCYHKECDTVDNISEESIFTQGNIAADTSNFNL
jgi:hypothetical protein